MEIDVTVADNVYVLNQSPTQIVSAITGRVVYINACREFVIAHSFDVAELKTANLDWNAYIRGSREAISEAGHKGVLSKVKISSDTTMFIERCFAAVNIDEFVAAADALVGRLIGIELDAADSTTVGEGRNKGKAGRKGSDSSRILEALILFWRHGMLLFPAAELWKERLIPAQSLPAIDSLHYESAPAFLLQMNEGATKDQRRSLRLFPLIMEGVAEVGDIDAQVVGTLKPFTERISPGVAALCDRLHASQRKAYAADAEKLAKIPQSYRAILKTNSRNRSDRTFGWAEELGGSRLKEWVNCSREYIESQKNRMTLLSEISSVNTVLDYVIEYSDIPSSPIDYCRRDYEPKLSIATYLAEHSRDSMARLLRVAFQLFALVIEMSGSDAHGVILREYSNPIDPEDIPQKHSISGQTFRNRLPLRYMRMLREIIESPGTDGTPTYAWPKSIASDQLKFVDPVTGKNETIWSPVRGAYFLLRFKVPLRGLQARLLDSGEADSRVYRPEQGGWVSNTSPHAPLDPHKPPNGFIRRIWDPDGGRWVNGLYVTTNKTADRAEGFSDPGYEIPWESPEIISLYCWLRDWQERYNPCITPLSRAELSNDKNLIVSKDVAERLDKLCFLFRDAVHSAYPQEPLSSGRAQLFWRLLLAELESRLEKSGERNLDGSRIKIIEEWFFPKKGKPRPIRAIFDTHSLRVTGITALLNAGVPLHIVSKCVVGHATCRMTLFYHKPGAGKITELLNEAWQRFAELELSNWDLHLKNAPLDLLRDIAAYNSEEGLRAAREIQSSLWATLDEGICPNGGTQCDKGGPLLSKSPKIHAPVPGGHRNCALCRFFVTGSAFMGGLIAKCNSTYAQMKEKLLRLKDAQGKRRALATEILNSAQRDGLPTQRRLALAADEVVQSVETEVDLITQTWFALVTLLERVRTIVQKRLSNPDDTTQALILNGRAEDFQVAMQDCTDYQLWDQICRSSVFYPGIDASMPSIRRARLYDAVLSRDGHPAYFATLTDAELVEVGNAMSSFLRTKLGDAVTNDLIDGRKTFRELGIYDELSAVLADLRPLHLVGNKITRQFKPFSLEE